MYHKIVIFFFSLIVIPLSYYFTKPFENDYKTVTTGEMEAITFVKDVNASKSNNIIYKSGVYRLSFASKVKEVSKKSFIKLEINHHPSAQFILKKDTTEIRKIHLFKNSLLTIKIDKPSFNKDDTVSVNFQFRDDMIVYQDIFIILILILFYIYAYKHHLAGNFLLIYVNYLLLLYAQQIGFVGVHFETNIAYLAFSFLLFLLFVLINNYVKNALLNTFIRFCLLLFLVLAPLATIVYGVSTHNQITNDAFNALFQSNIKEAYA